MGRRRTKNHGLPRRMRLHRRTYYYDHGYGPDGKRRWTRLSTDLREAKMLWARIEAEDYEPDLSGTVADMIDYYENKHLPKLAKRTQDDRGRHCERLRQAFGHMKPNDVKPTHVAGYLEAHASPVAANREISTLSVVYGRGMRIGMADGNPCAGVARNKEQRRDRYIEDWEFLAAKSVAPPVMQAVMDLAYLTGLSLGDILHMRRTQITDDGIRFDRRKTGSHQIITMTADLRAVLRRLQQARPMASATHVLCTRTGDPYTESGFKAMWQRTIRRALTKTELEHRFTFHDLRAKAASDSEAQGGDPQALLGHTTAKQTQTYLRRRKVVRSMPVRASTKADDD